MASPPSFAPKERPPSSTAGNPAAPTPSGCSGARLRAAAGAGQAVRRARARGRGARARVPARGASRTGADGRGPWPRTARRLGPRRALVARPHGAREAPLVERMTLVWHDWFATSRAACGCCARTRCCGGTRWATSARCCRARRETGDADVAQRDREQPPTRREEPASCRSCSRSAPAAAAADAPDGARADRLAHDWRDGVGMTNFRYDRQYHDGGRKRIHGRRARFDWRDAADLSVRHDLHPSFFVGGRTVSSDASAAGDRRALQRLYEREGHDVRPVLAAILRHPALHTARAWSSRRSCTPPGCCARWGAGSTTARGRG